VDKNINLPKKKKQRKGQVTPYGRRNGIDYELKMTK
jgi:hypothetical protein